MSNAQTYRTLFSPGRLRKPTVAETPDRGARSRTALRPSGCIFGGKGYRACGTRRTMDLQSTLDRLAKAWPVISANPELLIIIAGITGAAAWWFRSSLASSQVEGLKAQADALRDKAAAA